MSTPTPKPTRKFFELMPAEVTPRKCHVCFEPASWWLFAANRHGGKNLTSRQPVCRVCLAKERPNL